MITLLAGIVITITNALQAVTGFGSTVLALPFVTALLGHKEGVLLLAVLGWLIAVYFVIAGWRKIHFKQYLVITGVAGLGMPLGMHLADALPIPVLKRVLAGFIVVAAIIQFVRARRPATESEKKLPLLALTPLLFLGGIIHGAFASGGPLIVLYAARALPDKGNFRATLCLLWTTLNILLMVNYWRTGQFNAAFVPRLGVMLPFLAAGIFLGDLIHHRVNAVLFRKTVFVSLLAVG